MELSIIISTLAGLGYCLAYLDYNRNVFTGETKPNGATWAIWSAVSFVSTGSYIANSADFWKSLIPILNIILCIATFVLALVAGKLKKLDVSDWIALGLGLVAALVWAVNKSAQNANLIVQVAIMVGFVPTWRAVWATPASEHPRPWWIWSVSYAVSIIVVLLRWKNQRIDLVYPVVCTVLHASVPIVCFFRSRRMLKKS
jgi:hypothetical protein